MTMREAAPALARKLGISTEDALTLIRAESVLHRWAEQECGDGNDFASWAIERDEETGIPYKCVYPHKGESYRFKIRDREAGALRRVQEVCERNSLSWYHQTDPRGCALYASRYEITGSNYPRGVACCVDALRGLA